MDFQSSPASALTRDDVHNVKVLPAIVNSLKNSIAKIVSKGKDGKTPVKGVDYFTPKEVQEFLSYVTPKKGVHYTDGQLGKDGKNGLNGIGLPGIMGPKGEKGDSIVGPKGDRGDPGKTPVAGVDYPIPKDGEMGPVGPAGKDGKDGKDGKVNKEEVIAFSKEPTRIHEKDYDHSLIHSPFLLGTKTVDESAFGIGKFLTVGKDGKLVYGKPAKEVWQDIVHSVDGGAGYSSITAGDGITITEDAKHKGIISIASSITQYTDEMAQDAVGAMIGSSLQYVDATPLLDTIQDIQTSASPTFTGLTLSGLTAGRVTFASTGGLLADSSKLLWDNANGRLGIGGTPTGLLELVGSSNFIRFNTAGNEFYSDATTFKFYTTGTSMWLGAGGSDDLFRVYSTYSYNKTNLWVVQNLGLGTTPSTYNNAGNEYILDMTRTFTDATTSTDKRGVNASLTWNPTGTGTISQNVYAFNAYTYTDASEVMNNSGYMYGGYLAVIHRANSTIQRMAGMLISAGTWNGVSDTTGTITNLYGAYISGLKTTSSTITNAYGVYISGFSGTNAYDIYANDSGAYNYFAGRVGIGTTGPTAVLHLKAGTTTANTAPLQFTTGTSETSARAGLMQYSSGRFTLTDTDVIERHIVQSPATTTADVIPAGAVNVVINGVTYKLLYA